MTDERETVDDLETAERVTDPAAVYDDVDALPGWWRDLVHEFAEHDLRPYRPSRLADGAVTYEVVESLEARHDVEITLVSDDPHRSDGWRVVVDGETALTTTHERLPAGYTRYGITAAELADAVAAVGEDAP